MQLGGGAAWLRYVLGVHQVHQRLHNGVVGGIHVGIKGEGALSIAVVGRVAVRSDDPVLPAQLSEADIQLVSSACCLLIAAVVICWARPSGSLLRLRGSIAVLLAAFSTGRPGGADVHFTDFKEGHHERLLLQCTVSSYEPRLLRADALSTAGLHADLQTQVVHRTHHPQVARGSDVELQPALFSRPQPARLQQEQICLSVRVLLDHLVDFEQEGVVAEGTAHALLVEAKLGRGDGLALWDLREVELKLLVVTPLWGELPVVLH